MKLLRRLNTPPAGPDDPAATVVYAGAARTAADSLTGLLPDMPTIPRTWHYAAYACDPGDGCDTTAARAAVAVTLPELLRFGGYTIHWRHSAADVCADSTQFGSAATTSHPDWWRSCNADCGPNSSARQLNDAGRVEAATIGNILRSLQAPFDRVLSSEFCRCIETAQLMDLGPEIETRQELTFSVYDEPNRCARSRELLAVRPAPGMNRALVGHAGYPATCPDLGILAWSECALFKPDGAGGMTLVGTLKWTDWVDLSATIGPRPAARYR